MENSPVTPIIPNLENYRTLVEPTKPEENYWVGAPSATVDNGGTVWLTYRIRDPKGRGTETQICSSEDGRKFQLVKTIKKEELGAKSLERSSLVQDQKTGKFKLYMSLDPDYDAADPQALGWHIVKLDDEKDPSQFDPKSAEVVVFPEGSGPESGPVKDPYIINVGWRYYMFYTAKDGGGEQGHLATSIDGERWKKSKANPVIPRGGWHNFHTRVGCVIPRDLGFVIYYEGTNRQWYQPMYNILTGVATSLDMKEFFDVTPDEPLLSSPTATAESPGEGYKTLRYMDVVEFQGEYLFYYEATRQDGSFELRLTSHKPGQN